MPSPLRISELTPGRLVRLYETRRNPLSGELTLLVDDGFILGNMDGVSNGRKIPAGSLGMVIGPAPELFLRETDRKSVCLLVDGAMGWAYDSDCFDPEKTQ